MRQDARRRKKHRHAQSLHPDQRAETGPFDVVGDVHGCADTLRKLLRRLGYVEDDDAPSYRHPQGRRLLLLGDYVNRGPDSEVVLEIVRRTAANGTALALAGNHEEALLALFDEFVDDGDGGWVEEQPSGRIWHVANDTLEWLKTLPAHLIVDGGALVAVHACIAPRDIADASTATRHGAQWGTGDLLWWKAHDPSGPTIVHGHWVDLNGPVWRGPVIGIDCGCGSASGGRLAAYRHPERGIVQVEMAPKDAAHTRIRTLHSG